jgi:hypothetical protein
MLLKTHGLRGRSNVQCSVQLCSVVCALQHDPILSNIMAEEPESPNNEEVNEDEASSEEPVVVTLPPNCRVNEPIIYQLDILLDFVHPRRLKKDLIEVLLLYLVHEGENLSGDFKETAENYLLLFQWLDTVEKEMDERGF